MQDYKTVPGFMRKETSVAGEEKLRMETHQGGVDTIKKLLNRVKKNRLVKEIDGAIKEHHLEEEEKIKEDHSANGIHSDEDSSPKADAIV